MTPTFEDGINSVRGDVATRVVADTVELPPEIPTGKALLITVSHGTIVVLGC